MGRAENLGRYAQPRYEDPILGRVRRSKGCWAWLGGHHPDGYGTFYVATVDGKHIYRPAHRVVYERLVGPIPDGHDLHHTCGNKGCVNPRHLDPMTDQEHRTLHFAAEPMCANGLHPKIPGKPCRPCRLALWKRSNQRRPASTKGPTQTCEVCGKTVAVGYLSRHARAHV